MSLASSICLVIVAASSSRGFAGHDLPGTSLADSVLQELRSFLGADGPAERRLAEIHDAVEPLWVALPKDDRGNLGHDGVRYALHRFFVYRHGWNIDGLDRNLDMRGESWIPAILTKWVRRDLKDRIGIAFGLTGFSLNELVIIAATLEQIILDKGIHLLKDVFLSLGLPVGVPVGEREADEALDAYIISLVLGKIPRRHDETMRDPSRVYPGWSDTQIWLRDIRHTSMYLNRGKINPFLPELSLTYGHMEQIVRRVSEQFGSFQDTECLHLKEALLEVEENGTGRVRLSEFYRMALSTKLQFAENADYLQQLGALDRTKSGEPRVIMPNYLLSPANCLTESQEYSICCISECEGLIRQIERAIASPQAAPELLASVVANMSSSTVDGPRVLAPHMSNRLIELAARHGGSVPLHGRMFAQWLHFAFPRECPYPYRAEWKKPSQPNTVMNTLNMKAYIESVQQSETKRGGTGDTGPPSSGDGDDVVTEWVREEESLFMSAGVTDATQELVNTVRQGLLIVVGFALTAITFFDGVRRVLGLESCLGSAESFLVLAI